MPKVVIKTVRRMAPRAGSPVGLPGNIAINEDRKIDPVTKKVLEDNTIYLSNSDYVNTLLSQDMDAGVPCTKLMGGVIGFDELNVTAEMIAAGGGSYTFINNRGREIKFRTPGKKQVNWEITFPAFEISQSDINMAHMKAISLESRLKRTQILTAPARPTAAPEIEAIDDQEIPNDTPVVDPNSNPGGLNEGNPASEAPAHANLPEGPVIDEAEIVE